jgi:cytochrome c-type biogenesis protein CcmH/NrfF
VIRRWGPWVALGVVVVIALAVVLWPSGSQSAAERAHDLETELKCPECQGLSVADSQAPTSRAIRADVKRRIAAGQSDEEIRQAYVDKYGESILLSPQDSGVSLIVWILPIVVVALGATGIVFALRRNRDEPHLRATAADERLVGRARDDRASGGERRDDG